MTVVPYAERLTVDNIERIIKDYDISRRRVGQLRDPLPRQRRRATSPGKPNVHGSIFQFEGMVTVLAPGRGPCYRCLYPMPAPAGLVPS